jgi:hypothetical protein
MLKIYSTKKSTPGAKWPQIQSVGVSESQAVGGLCRDDKGMPSKVEEDKALEGS